MTAPRFLKDPDAVVDYPVNWLPWLGADTIASSTWAIFGGADSPPSLTVNSETNTNTTATAWLSGGEPGVDYLAANRIVTAGGRTEERTLVIHVRDNL